MNQLASFRKAFATDKWLMRAKFHIATDLINQRWENIKSFSRTVSESDHFLPCKAGGVDSYEPSKLEHLQLVVDFSME